MTITLAKLVLSMSVFCALMDKDLIMGNASLAWTPSITVIDALVLKFAISAIQILQDSMSMDFAPTAFLDGLRHQTKHTQTANAQIL